MPKKPSKPILSLDFDGVIHSYASGWKGIDNIPDDPVPGAFEFIEKAIPHFRVCLYSSRSREEKGRLAMVQWFVKHELDKQLLDQLEFPSHKPAAKIQIDDRCFHFEGKWPDVGVLLEFEPWWKIEQQRQENADYAKKHMTPEVLKELVGKNDVAKADREEIIAEQKAMFPDVEPDPDLGKPLSERQLIMQAVISQPTDQQRLLYVIARRENMALDDLICKWLDSKILSYIDAYNQPEEQPEG